MSLELLTPRPNERMMIVGHTGSGKTTLARALLASANYPRVLVIDPKCTYGGQGGEEGYELVRTPSELARFGRKFDRIQYRPGPNSQSVEHYDAVYAWAYKIKDVMVYTDETYLTMKGNRSPDWQRACITCGREINVGMIMGTQRPRGIDPRVRTEADVRAQFELWDEEDREAFWGKRWKYFANPNNHAFWFYRPGMEDLRLFRLSLGGKKETNG